MRKRDFQKSKVYRAEREHSLWKPVKRSLTASGRSTILLFPDGEKPMSVQECKDYIGKIMRSRWWKAQFKPFPAPDHLLLKDGRGTRNARGGLHGMSIVINLPRWARSKIVILHELAHTMTSRFCAPHGRRFCSNYLALIKRWMGKDAWLEMKSLYKSHRVKFRKQKGGSK